MEKQLIKTAITFLVKPISVTTFIISTWGFSGWLSGVTQAAPPNLDSSFAEWCLQKESLSTEERKTV